MNVYYDHLQGGIVSIVSQNYLMTKFHFLGVSHRTSVLQNVILETLDQRVFTFSLPEYQGHWVKIDQRE